MTITSPLRHIHSQRIDNAIHDHPRLDTDWPQESVWGDSHDYSEEIFDHITKLPSPEQIQKLCSTLRAVDLRQLSAAIVNGSIEHAKEERGRLDYLRLLNSWLATAEETVAAGKNIKRIASRRSENL